MTKVPQLHSCFVGEPPEVDVLRVVTSRVDITHGMALKDDVEETGTCGGVSHPPVAGRVPRGSPLH
jgi:hypothetical protein